MTAALNERREDVPEELTSSVDSLTATLRAVTDQDTTPQDRGTVTDSVKDLASTLDVISDDGTPGELRDQLTGLVKQVTATLEAGQEPDVPAEDRSRLFLVAQRTTSLLNMVSDPEASPTLGWQQREDIKNANYTAEQSRGGGERGYNALWMSSSMGDFHHSRMSREQREEFGDAIAQSGRQMRVASDPESSPEERAEARHEMRKQIARMKDEQRKAASAQERPDASLGKAAEVCASAIFESVSERKISKGLKDLTPQSWDSAGVKDFWKARAEENNVLDVRAFLRNNENTHAPFPVAELITSLADVVRVDELNPDVGGIPAAHCRQSAVYLEEQGITAGDWGTTDDW